MSASLEELVERFLDELRNGGEPDLEAYVREHPAHADELRRLLPAVAFLQRATHPVPGVEPAPGPSSRSMAGLVQRLGGRGNLFERYRLQGELARGGQGAVLAVFDEDLRRHLAMKVVHEGATSTSETSPIDSRSLGRFLEEAQVTSQLDHPGIVPVHELGLDREGRVYFTMKLVKGRTLREILALVHGQREGWNETRALGVMLKVCEAVAYAHHKGVIHRDLKPANVMVGNFGEVYVMDWGLARVLAREDAHDLRLAPVERTSVALRTGRTDEREESPDSPVMTMDGDVVGTPGYMPPEQARGEIERLSPRSDVYAIGAMLYHLLARHMPFATTGARMSNRMVLLAVTQGPPAPLASLRKDAPAALVAIVEKAMAREPAERYADTLALAEDLRAYLENRVVKAYETGAFAELSKWVARNKALASSIAAALVLLVAGLTTSLILKAQSDRRADEVLRLSALQELEDLVAEADRLWPAVPANLVRYEDWLNGARDLVASLPAHEANLALFRGRALPRNVATLVERGASERAEWNFTDKRDKWWHNQLEKLVAGLGAFMDPETGLLTGISPEHGWGVERRVEWARSLRESTVDGEEAARRWSEAIESIANPAECPGYGGLRIPAQLGLLPIGRDPASGLWEFAHLQTGARAERGADGKLVLEEETGLVFVLLPGGNFEMGAQASDPAGPNYDPQATDAEGPVHSVTLMPFFLSKYEMTQGQWQRCAGDNPSQYRVHPPAERDVPGRKLDGLHPVELVDWNVCMDMCRRLGLSLPSEAQWEYGARAGTTTAWWTGDEKESLQGAANLADSHAFLRKPGWTRYEEWLDDGGVAHVPVGTYRPNRFGLHDVIGNVSEWCLDGWKPFHSAGLGQDPVVDPASSQHRVSRGGNSGVLAAGARSAKRAGDVPEKLADFQGLRPARAVTGH